MGRFARLNEYGLDHYLRGEAGELARREAQQELWERGQRAAEVSEEEMVSRLKGLGYVVFKGRQHGR